MSSNLNGISDLPWLPRLSEDFRVRLKALDSHQDWALELRSLANQAIGLNQAISLTQALQRMQAAAPSKSLTKFRLGLISNATLDFLKPMLIATALRFGIALEIIAADFGQIMQEAIDPQSMINQARPDAVLLAIDHRGLPFRLADQREWPLYDAQAAISDLDAIREGFRTNCGAVCLVQTLAAPAELLLGSIDVATPGTLRSVIDSFNAHVGLNTSKHGDVVVDIAWLAQSIGLDHWYDDRQWHIARLPFSQKMLPIYADIVCRMIAALRGKSRKCLILDLDNTLWGGVIGDDGMDGIELSPGDARGEAFRAIQTAALDLRRRGIVLAVCSKNTDAIARQPFQSHQDMILRESDIAVFRANWDDKASNIELIAQQLELGLDAMVFLDDNPVERAQVRQVLPTVAVPELGDDPSTYAKILLTAGYFESAAFTREDRDRAEQYKNNAERAQALQGSRNMEEFLSSLNMQISFAPFSSAQRKRITQLINKTNQFNVTTRRYTEQQVAELETSGKHYTLQVAVRDRFGDNGMISVVICTRGNSEWQIDTWLMSCRVLNRKVEQAVLNRIALDAHAAGATRLIGTYLPTARNDIVKDLFSSLGFKSLGGDAQEQRFALELEQFVAEPVPFQHY